MRYWPAHNTAVRIAGCVCPPLVVAVGGVGVGVGVGAGVGVVVVSVSLPARVEVRHRVALASCLAFWCWYCCVSPL